MENSKQNKKTAVSSNGKGITQKLEHQSCASSLATKQQGKWAEAKQEKQWQYRLYRSSEQGKGRRVNLMLV